MATQDSDDETNTMKLTSDSSTALPPSTSAERRKAKRASERKERMMLGSIPLPVVEAPTMIEVKDGEAVPVGYTPLFTAEEKAAMKSMTPGQKHRFLQNRKREQALEATIRRKIGDDADDKKVAALKAVLRAAQDENPSASGSMKTIKKKANAAIERVVPVAMASVGEEHKEGLEMFHKEMKGAADQKAAAAAASEAARPITEVVYE